MENMDQNTFIAALILVVLLGALAGSLVTYLRLHRRIAVLSEKNTELSTTLELERKSHADKLETLEQARTQLSETFGHLSSQALKHNNEEFLKLAQENLKKFQARAQGDLSQKEQAIENLVKPIKEALEKTEKQIRMMENERKEAYGSLTKHLPSLVTLAICTLFNALQSL